MKPHKDEIEKKAGVTLAILPSSTTRGLTDLAQGRADIAMLAEPLETAAESVNGKLAVRVAMGYDAIANLHQQLGKLLVGLSAAAAAAKETKTS